MTKIPMPLKCDFCKKFVKLKNNYPDNIIYEFLTGKSKPICKKCQKDCDSVD